MEIEIAFGVEVVSEFDLVAGTSTSGVFVKNPSLAAYAEVRNIFKDNGDEATAKDMKILSIGTGNNCKAYKYSKAKSWGMVEWVQPVIDIIMSGSANVAHYQLDKIYGAIGNPDQYLRIDKDLDPDVTGMDTDMDCVKPDNMAGLKEFRQHLFEENNRKI